MTREYSDKIIDKINEVMKRKDITRVELAEKLDLNKYTLGNYLLKHRTLPFEIAIMLAKELDIDINRLYGLSNYPLDKDLFEAYQEFKKKADKIVEKESSHSMK